MAREPTVCAECGAQVIRDDSFRLIINSPAHDEIDATFCRQDHAAHWLTKSIPSPWPDAPFTAGELLFVFSSLAMFALAIVGVIALFGGDVNPF